MVVKLLLCFCSFYNPPIFAFNSTDRKTLRTTRDKAYLEQHHPLWMITFSESLPDIVEAEAEETVAETDEDRLLRKAKKLKRSIFRYERFAWTVYANITSQAWFEAFILANILLIGVATGLDLEAGATSPSVAKAAEVISDITTAVFTLEVILKIVAEGFEPLTYFTDSRDGGFNTFDFAIVLGSYAVSIAADGASLGSVRMVRMLRLVRLLTFIKGVEQLRVIVAGLIQGFRSVFYIVVLLVLVIYLFGIMGCIVFGDVDPVHFGTVSIAMFSLFQVSTLASWSSIAVSF